MKKVKMIFFMFLLLVFAVACGKQIDPQVDETTSTANTSVTSLQTTLQTTTPTTSQTNAQTTQQTTSKPAETLTETEAVTEPNIETILQNSEKINDVLYFYDEHKTVYLIRDNEIIETFRSYDTSPYFFYSSVDFKYGDPPIDFDIPPYFKSNMKLYTYYNDEISEVQFFVDGKNIYDLTERAEFLQYVMKTGDRSFIVYIKDLSYYSIGINGKIEFTYNPENNSFEGEYIENISPEAEQIVDDLYYEADFLEEKINVYNFVESEYELTYTPRDGGDLDKIVYFDNTAYSKITEEGFRTKAELMAQLNEIYTPEYAEEIYKSWTVKDVYSPPLAEKDNELYIIIPDGHGDNSWGKYCFDVISADEETIEARVIMIIDRDALPYINNILSKNVILKMTPDGYRISENFGKIYE
jgi:hypothetical protein